MRTARPGLHLAPGSSSRDPPGEKSGSFPEDLDFLFKPLDLTPEPLGLGLFGFAGSECLSGAGCELLVAPLAELPRADTQSG